MKQIILLSFLAVLTLVTSSQSWAERGGKITIGESVWTVVPAIQCSVYPGNIVSIAGHAAEDASVEIAIDFGGPTGVRVGEGANAWHAQKDSLDIQIDGKRVSGTATFFQYSGGPEDAKPGSIDVSCI